MQVLKRALGGQEFGFRVQGSRFMFQGLGVGFTFLIWKVQGPGLWGLFWVVSGLERGLAHEG